MISNQITGPGPTMGTVPVNSTGADKYVVPEQAEKALKELQEHFPDIFLEARRFRDELTIYVPRENIVDVSRYLHDTAGLNYNYLNDLTGNDWLERDPRFEVIYQLYSLEHHTYLRLKVRVPEDDCTCPSVTSVWGTANWHEREVFDMFGINFDGHPDLRHILLPDEWEGHPLRQDYDISYEATEFTVRKVHRDYAKG